MRDRIVEYFWRIQMWPYQTKEEYYRFWDWRYNALSEVEPATWIALEGDTIIGHVALLFRDLYLNGQRIRAGVTTNLRVDDSYRNGALAVVLTKAPRTAARRGEFDLLTSHSTSSAHQLAVAVGHRELGSMQTFVRVLRWYPVLRRRSPKLVPMVPVVRAASRVYQTIRGTAIAHVPPFFVARMLSAAEVRSLDLSHWRVNESMNWNGSLGYYANRFCGSEYSDGRVFGVVDNRTGAVEAVVAVSGSARLTILQCDVNERVISRALAVEATLRVNPGIESVHVPLLPKTALAEEFVRAGYTGLPARLEDPWIHNRSWSVWWRPEHPLAGQLERISRWNLWLGWAHH
jgi:hypothetical protein